MALPASGALSLGNVNVELGLSSIVQISLGATGVRTLYQVASGAIRLAADGYGKSNTPLPTQKAIFGFGSTPAAAPPSVVSMSNLVSSAGVVATDTPGVGTARSQVAGAGYGGDKAIFGFGFIDSGTNIINLVSNTGVVASDTAGAPGVSNRRLTAAANYGGDKAIFAFGLAPGVSNTTNLVSNTGVVASNTAGVGTARQGLAAAGYGSDKAIFGFGAVPGVRSITNLLSNTGIVAADTPGVGTARTQLAAAGYGGDKAIFGFGVIAPNPSANLSMTNLVSNTGVMATDTPGVVTARALNAAAGYGGDKAIFAFGQISPASAVTNIRNLVSNTGVVASDTPGIGTARLWVAAAGYSTTA